MRFTIDVPDDMMREPAQLKAAAEGTTYEEAVRRKVFQMLGGRISVSSLAQPTDGPPADKHTAEIISETGDVALVVHCEDDNPDHKRTCTATLRLAHSSAPAYLAW